MTGQPDRSKYLLVHKVFIQRPRNHVIDPHIVHTMCIHSYLLSITSISNTKSMLYVRTSVSTHAAISPYSDIYVSLQTWISQICELNSSLILTVEWSSCTFVFVQIYSERDLQWRWMVRKKRIRGTHLLHKFIHRYEKTIGKLRYWPSCSSYCMCTFIFTIHNVISRT